MAARRLSLRTIAAVTAAALLAAIAVLVLFGGDDDSSADDGAAGMDLAPAGEVPGSVDDVVLASLDGGDDAALGDYTGSTPVVVNFFASWCVPCVDEMPAFERVHQDLGDQVTFLGMSNRDTPEDALATVESTGVTYPTFLDPDTSALTYFGGLGMPTTVFIDASGEVVDVNSGALTEDELRAKLDDLFGVPT